MLTSKLFYLVKMLFFEEPTEHEKTVEERFFEAVYPIEGRLIIMRS